MKTFKEYIDEISKQTAQKYLNKTVDPVMGMPRPGYKNLNTRMKGIQRASKIVASEQTYDVEKGRAQMKKILADRAAARKHVEDLAQKLAKEKEKKENK